MERVQFEQEQMLAELKDLGEKGLFSSAEIKQIIQRRTAFETALVRRVPNKNDYLRYAAYEMGLEALRRKRAARLKLPRSPPSISDYALTRRQYGIFERALLKFKADVSLWLQYLRVAQRTGARALAGRVAARAVQLHPRTPALYVLAAAHELAHGGMSAARALLQRGLRLNAGDSAELWREYVRLELGFVEAVRRRWDVLGISLSQHDDAAAAAAATASSDRGRGPGAEREPDADGGVDGQRGQGGQGERLDRAEEEAMGDGARRAIMDGAIVRQAIDSASKALPTLELFKNLQSLIADYPSSDTLRKSLLDHLHARLAEALPCDAAAVTLRATRGLTLTSGSAEDAGRGGLVDALQRANEEMVAALDADLAEGCPRDELAGAYAQFVEEWCGKEEIDAHLKLYLVCSLQALIKRKGKETPCGILLATHVRLLLTLAELPCPPAAPGRILRIARRYTCSTPTDTGVWLARLHAESVHGTADSVNEAWTSARRAVRMSSEIWLWGADRCCPSSSESSGSWEAIDSLLAESMREGELREVHEALLLRVAERIGTLTRATERRERVEHVARRCLPSARVWARVFGAVSGGEKEGEDEEGLVREVYEYWRGTGEEEEATLGFARWLLFEKRRGEEALRLISVAGGGTAVRTRWARIVRLGTAESGEIRKDGETRSV